MIRKVISYRCADGEVFESKKDAQAWEGALAATKGVEKVVDEFDLSSAANLAKQIYTNRHKLLPFLVSSDDKVVTNQKSFQSAEDKSLPGKRTFIRGIGKCSRHKIREHHANRVVNCLKRHGGSATKTYLMNNTNLYKREINPVLKNLCATGVLKRHGLPHWKRGATYSIV